MNAEVLDSSPPRWEILNDEVGTPPSRPATAHERLFGSELPLLQLWHDRAGWSPFCAGTRMILEEMRIPHTLKKTSLHNYMAPGEGQPQEFIDLTGHRGFVPAVQLASEEARANGEISFGPAVQTAYAVSALLAEVFPEEWPMPRTPQRRACALAQMSLVERLEMSFFPFMLAISDGVETTELEDQFLAVMDDIVAALDGPYGHGVNQDKPFIMHETADDGDGDAFKFGGPLDGGPFLFGSRPSAVDFLLLPLLERVEAWLTHPLAGNRPEFCLEKRWPSAAKMLTAVREPGACPAYDEFGSDLDTLVGMAVRERESGRCRKLGFVSGILVSQLGCPEDLCQKVLAIQRDASLAAAAALCSNHAAVAGFSLHSMGVGRFWDGVHSTLDKADDNVKSLGAMDSTLRLVASLLLEKPAALPALRKKVDVFSALFLDQYGVDCTRLVIEALKFLSWNVSVPRDMAASAAQALRAHVRFVAAVLEAIVDDRKVYTK